MQSGARKVGRALSRSEFEEVHDLGPAFLDVRDLSVREDATPADGSTLVQELPDADIVRAYVAQDYAGADGEALVADLLALLGDGGPDAREVA